MVWFLPVLKESTVLSRRDEDVQKDQVPASGRAASCHDELV
jgi:hypothetical protein